MKKIDVTFGRVNEVLDYNQETGHFIWKVKRLRPPTIGERAGYLNGGGYRIITIDGKQCYEHRLAWLIVHGYLPENIVEHINGIRDDNRISNLQEASMSCNSFKSKRRRGRLPRNVSSTFAGFQVKFTVNGKPIDLGTFPTLPEAATVAKAFREKRTRQFLENENCNANIPA